MDTHILKSYARLSYIQGTYIRDLVVVIDDPAVFNALPGKHERSGIKTIASWPIFVTAVLSECYPLMIGEPAITEHAVRELAESYSQIPLIDQITTARPKALKSNKRKVERTLAEIRKLHEELNGQLYSHPTERPVIHSPSDAYGILVCFIGNLDHEELWVLNLDTRNRVMSMTALYKGSVNSSQVRVGEVFRQAIFDNSPSIILAHNHPSGDASPSPDDVSVTRAIVQAGKLLDIDVLDHLIVTCSGYVSLKERGLGFGG